MLVGPLEDGHEIRTGAVHEQVVNNSVFGNASPFRLDQILNHLSQLARAQEQSVKSSESLVD